MTICGMCGMYVFMFNERILVRNVGLRARAYCLKNEIHQEQKKMIKLRSKERRNRKKETKFLQSTAEIEKSNKQYYNSHQKSEKEINKERMKKK